MPHVNQQPVVTKKIALLVEIAGRAHLHSDRLPLKPADERHLTVLPFLALNSQGGVGPLERDPKRIRDPGRGLPRWISPGVHSSVSIAVEASPAPVVVRFVGSVGDCKQNSGLVPRHRGTHHKRNVERGYRGPNADEPLVSRCRYAGKRYVAARIGNNGWCLDARQVEAAGPSLWKREARD